MSVTATAAGGLGSGGAGEKEEEKQKEASGGCMSVTATAAGGLGIRVIMNKKIYLVKECVRSGLTHIYHFAKRYIFLS